MYSLGSRDIKGSLVQDEWEGGRNHWIGALEKEAAGWNAVPHCLPFHAPVERDHESHATNSRGRWSRTRPGDSFVRPSSTFYEHIQDWHEMEQERLSECFWCRRLRRSSGQPSSRQRPLMLIFLEWLQRWQEVCPSREKCDRSAILSSDWKCWKVRFVDAHNRCFLPKADISARLNDGIGSSSKLTSFVTCYLNRNLPSDKGVNLVQGRKLMRLCQMMRILFRSTFSSKKLKHSFWLQPGMSWFLENNCQSRGMSLNQYVSKFMVLILYIPSGESSPRNLLWDATTLHSGKKL